MLYLQLEQVRGCKFENFNETEGLVTPVCKNCGKQHRIADAEFDSVEIKESIRIIDYNRDRLIHMVEKLYSGSMSKKERDAVLETIKKIKKEMNDAVRMICAQNDLYGCREMLLKKGRIRIVKI